MKKKKIRAVSVSCLDEDIIKQIRIWRNQDFVRKQMFNTKLISEDEHVSFISKLIDDPDRDMFVFYLDDTPFGIYQYKVLEDGDTLDVGDYLIKQEYQDMGYGFLMIYAFSQIALHILHYHRSYFEIFEDNELAKKTSEGLGVKPYKEYVRDNRNVLCYCSEYVSEIDNSKEYKLFHKLIEDEPWEERVVIEKN